MRIGAYDYITKPIDTNRLRTILQNASALLGARVELEVTRRKLRDAGSLGCLVGPSRKRRKVSGLVERWPQRTPHCCLPARAGLARDWVRVLSLLSVHG